MDCLLFDNMTQCTSEEVALLLPMVSTQRREQALRYTHIFGQYTCLKSFCLLVDLLRKHSLLSPDELPCFEYNTYGKPFIKNGCEFSISHCKEGIIVGIDRKPIGVDIESIRSANEALIKRTMNTQERAYIAAAQNPNIAFTHLWTQKEAVVKLRGTGINGDLQQVLNTEMLPHLQTIETHRYIYTIATAQ